jgi:hypothetical protein
MYKVSTDPAGNGPNNQSGTGRLTSINVILQALHGIPRDGIHGRVLESLDF